MNDQIPHIQKHQTHPSGNKHWEIRLEQRWSCQRRSFHLKAQLLGDRLPPAESLSGSSVKRTLEYVSLTNFSDTKSGHRERQVYVVGTFSRRERSTQLREEEPQLSFHLVATLSSVPVNTVVAANPAER